MPNQTRRDMASAAALIGLFGAAGPFMGPTAAEVDPDKQPAHLEHYAAQEFEAWGPDLPDQLSTIGEWRDYAAHEYALIRLAFAAMQRDHRGAAVVAAEAPQDVLIEFVDNLRGAAARYRGLADVLDGAGVRMMCGMARHLVAIGEA